MTTLLIPVLAAVFVWWFATGALLLAVRWADRQGGAAHGLVLVGAVPLLAVGAAGVILSQASPGVAGVYAGFLGALAVWGWIELAFLTGIIAGPDRRDCPPGLTGRARFARAWATVAHHEIALALGLLGIAAITAAGDSRIALWTYLILFAARIMAKLNLFFGVPRINLEFIPARMAHLRSHLRRGPVTPAWPAAMVLLALTVGCCLVRLTAAADAVTRAECALLAALAALALLEHALMVLPLPDAKLWRWMLPAPTRLPNPLPQEERQPHGF